MQSIRNVAIQSGVISQTASDLQVNEAVSGFKQFDWKAVSLLANVPKPKVKRWFDETFQRRLFGSVSKEDTKRIRLYI